MDGIPALGLGDYEKSPGAIRRPSKALVEDSSRSSIISERPEEIPAHQRDIRSSRYRRLERPSVASSGIDRIAKSLTGSTRIFAPARTADMKTTRHGLTSRSTGPGSHSLATAGQRARWADQGRGPRHARKRVAWMPIGKLVLNPVPCCLVMACCFSPRPALGAQPSEGRPTGCCPKSPPSPHARRRRVLCPRYSKRCVNRVGRRQKSHSSAAIEERTRSTGLDASWFGPRSISSFRLQRRREGGQERNCENPSSLSRCDTWPSGRPCFARPGVTSLV